MGKISSEPHQQTAETIATHFSHPHPFELIDCHQTLNLSPSCSGCNLKPSGLVYSCTVCTHFLHKKCFEMPKNITHPFHKDHAFTLLPQPAYTEGVYNCDACGETGSGFSYHCKPCGIDLHTLCAAMPLSVTTAYHPHKLELNFESPYDTKNFICDICKCNGSDHWLYRCKSCEFDAHLKCARGAPPVVGFQGQVPALQRAATCSRSVPVPRPQGPSGQHFMAATPAPLQQNYMPHPMTNNAAVGVPAGGVAAVVPSPVGVNGQHDLLIQAIMQMVQNNNAMTQAMLAGGTGGGFGGGFGGDRGLQQLMQLTSALSNSGFGGGGIPGLDAFGGGLDALQSLLGGGGLDLLGGLGGFL